MSAIDIDAIRKREQAATDGPWTPDRVDIKPDRFNPSRPNHRVLTPTGSLSAFCGEGAEGEANAEFIAHARQDIPALLAEVERVTQDRDRYARTAADLLRQRNEAADQEEHARAQVADLADKLHKANAQIDSLSKAGTAWANENAELRTTLGEIAGMCNCRDDGDCPSLVARRGLADNANNADNAHANEVASLRRELETAEREAVFGVADAVERIDKVRRLCDEYKDQPPPIFQGPGLSEHGKGYNAGTRDMARAVLTTLADELLDAADEAEVAR